MWGVDKMKIRWKNQAEEQQAEVFFGERKGDTGKLPETWEKTGR